MKKNTNDTATTQAAAVENRDLFMTLVRDSLRSVAEQMLLEEVSGKRSFGRAE